MNNTFKHLFILGRPAAGKSEFIAFIKNTPLTERTATFHIGRFEEMDDFLWLWEKFIEDDLWEEAGFRRLYSKRLGPNYALNPEDGRLFDFCLARFNREIRERYLAYPEFYNDATLIIEFSRGGEDAFGHAFSKLSNVIFERAAIFYIDVSFDESWRRNVARYEENLRHSVLAHMVPRETIDAFYKTNDWEKLTKGQDDGFLDIHGIRVPFVTMKNEPELPPGPEIGLRYKKALTTLWRLHENS